MLNRVEDVATTGTSRARTWRWSTLVMPLDTGGRITRPRAGQVAIDQLVAFPGRGARTPASRGGWGAGVRLLMLSTLDKSPLDFPTPPAYESLD